MKCLSLSPAIRRFVAVLLISLIAAPELLTAAVSPELPNPGNIPGASKEQQEQLGLQARSEVYKQMPVLPDSSPVTQYVRNLGQRLTGVIPQQYSWPYEFHVVQEKDINAFALPGGPIFVNIGTITAADNEAELAGVIAHEMSHIYMQHSVKQQRKAALPSILGGLAAAAAGMVGGAAGALGQIGAQVVAGSFIMKYSRADEAQADAVGAIIMYKAGYNPEAMADFFKKLEQESGGNNPPQFLSDHPNPGNREAAIQKEIQNWPSEQWRNDTPNFQAARTAATKVRAYTAQEIAERAKSGGGWNNQTPQRTSGSVSSDDRGGSIAPQPVSVSHNWRNLQGPGFTIQYPDNWQSYGSQQSAITLAPTGGVTQNAVAYGAIIDAFQPQNARASLDTKVRQLVSSIQQTNAGLRMSGSSQPVTVNGVRGRSVELTGTSPVASNGKALTERDWLVAVPQADGSLLYIVFIAPDRDFSQLRPAFEQMLRTLRLQAS
jgi:Zn-dependent protease with chaperone function